MESEEHVLGPSCYGAHATRKLITTTVLRLLVPMASLLSGCLSHERAVPPEPLVCDELPLAAPVAHRAPPSDACGGTVTFPVAIPLREIPHLEEAALSMTDALVPRQADYDRLVADDAAIEVDPDRRGSRSSVRLSGGSTSRSASRRRRRGPWRRATTTRGAA